MFESTVVTIGPECPDRSSCATAIEQNQRLGIVQSCRQLVLAAEFADLYPAEGITESKVPGGETPYRPGGEGTPAIAAFSLAELAGLLGTTSGSAARLFGDALDLRHRLPLTWRRVVAAEIPGYLARKVAQATRRLSPEAAALVDVEIVDKLGVLSFGRLVTCLEAAVMKADPAAAQAAAEAVAKDRFVRLSQSSEHGLKWVIARCAAGDAIYLDAMISRIADILAERGDLDPLDVRRSKALGILAQPAEAMKLLYDHRGDPADQGEPGHAPSPVDPAKARPKAVIYVHLSEEALRAGTGVARMEGIGPVLMAQLRLLLGDLVVVKLQPVIDLNDTPAPVDSYEIPNRIREHLILRNPADLFPYAGGMARRQGGRCVDIDHTTPYRPPDDGGPPGQTGMGKLAPFARFHHRVKTHGLWQARQPEPGTLIWRTPLGRIYLVNHSGTHALGTGAFALAVWQAAATTRPSTGEQIIRKRLLALAT